jgi:hypothetical protein
LQNWDYIVDNPNCLARLQSLIQFSNSTINGNFQNGRFKLWLFLDSELFELDNVLIPVRVRPIGKGLLTNDGLIYQWENELKVNVGNLDLNGASSDEEDPDKFFDSTDSEDDEQQQPKKLATSFQERRSHTKVHPEDR